MKKVLIQGRFSNESHIDSIKYLLEDDFKDSNLELDFVFCLRQAKFPITDYNLIISHPHVFDNCCVPLIEEANKKGISIVFIYNGKFPNGERIRAIAENLQIPLSSKSMSQREMYEDLIRKILYKKE